MIFFIAFLSLAIPDSFGQQLSYSFSIEQQDDPAYKLYKDGYSLVLDAKWKDAQKKFEEVLKLYPNSSYRDDASYWSAYCLKYQDWKKAIDALRKFLKDFPKSSYRGDALEALCPSWNFRRSRESFRTVRDILLDRNENARLREEALRIISRYQKFDILPTLKDVAKNDPERRLRHGAIYYIGKFEKDKDAATGVLIELYTATPKDSTQLKERLLYSIARTRTEKGMDFLVNIAKSEEDSKLRESALYWLGKYGEGKKKKALYEILKKK